MSETVHAHGSCCPAVNTLNIIDGKWEILISYYLNSEARRFNELRRLLAGIAQRILTLQLRELENDGVIYRKVYPQIPPKIEYSLTESRRTLMPVIEAMHRWGEQCAVECVKHKKQPWVYAFMVMILMKTLRPLERV